MKKNPPENQSRYEKVLLIDDNEIDNFINERILTTTNFAHEVTVENSAISALDYIIEVIQDSNQMPDIIFLDLNMPLMDGFGFLEEFEKIYNPKTFDSSKCKIIILSSSISPIDFDKASTNPFVFKYLTKPLSEKLLQTIDI